MRLTIIIFLLVASLAPRAFAQSSFGTGNGVTNQITAGAPSGGTVGQALTSNGPSQGSYQSQPVRWAPWTNNTTPAATNVWTVNCPDSWTFPANFSGSYPNANAVVSCGTNPSETDVYPILINSNVTGSLNLSPSCGATFNTAPTPVIRNSTLATAGSTTINTPANLTGDLLIWWAAVATATVTTPAGWTLISNHNNSSASVQINIYALVSNGSEPTTFTLAGATFPAMAMAAIENPANGTTLDANVATDGGVSASTTQTVPATTNLSTAQGLLFGAFSFASGSAAPTGPLTQVQYQNYGSSVNYGLWVGKSATVASSTSAQSETFGTAVFTSSSAIVVAPAVGGGIPAICSAGQIMQIGPAPTTVSGSGLNMTLAGHTP